MDVQVASCYKAMGAMVSDRPANNYFPGSFAQGQDRNLGLAAGLMFGDEMEIVFS
jgi:hypothetical protein